MTQKLDFFEHPNPTGKSLEQFLADVDDEISFLRFLKALADDKYLEDRIEEKNPSSPYTAGTLGWEYNDIGGYLDAAAHCGASLLSSTAKKTEENPWKRAALILFNGKNYE